MAKTNNDPLRPARGITIGLALCIPFWMLMAGLYIGLSQSAKVETARQETTLGSSFRSASEEAGR